HLDVELGGQVNAEIVLGDQGVGSAALDVEAHGLEADRDDLVDDGDDEDAAVADDAGAAHAGADEGHVGRRLAVEAEDDGDGEADDGDEGAEAGDDDPLPTV